MSTPAVLPTSTSTPLARAFTWRSIIIGTLGVIAVCGLTPFNDFVFSDTSLCAGFLPLIVVLIQFLLIVGINAPLHRWAPRYALTTGELAVILLMVLVACSLPNWGLMRFFIPTPVAPFHLGQSDGTLWKMFVDMGLPKWLFPVDDIKSGRTSHVVQWFYNHVPAGESIPYRSWIIPLLTWGVFIAAMLATLAAMARLVLDQWTINERLPFPLMQVQASLIEAPAAGNALNNLLRSRALWIGLGGVFFIHMLSCLNAYFPKNFPKIPLGFDLTNILSQEPFVYLRPKLKKAMLSFMVVGVTYFIRSRVACSLWAIYLLVNVIEVQQQMQMRQMTEAAWRDQHLGACAAFVAGILWIGRTHWMQIIKNAFGIGTDSNYRLSFWIVIGGSAVMLGWLAMVGVHFWIAAVIVLFILSAHLIVTRVVAETGLPFFRTGIGAWQIYSNAPPSWSSTRDVYFANVFTVLGPVTSRDSLTCFATHGLGVCQSVGIDNRQRRKLGGAIAWALMVGVIVAAFATLHCQYSYPTPLSQGDGPNRNWFGAEYSPKRDIAIPMDEFAHGKFSPKQQNPFLHATIGFAVTGILEIASLRWASWPLLPVGYVASQGAFIQNAWFSIFIGWLAKVLIVRFGGTSLFTKARPFFVGIIFGEALAAGIWLIINALLVMNGGQGPVFVRFML